MPLDIIAVLPELLLFIGSMGLLMLGVFARGDVVRSTNYAALGLLALAALLVMTGPMLSGREYTAFNGSFIVDRFAIFMKVLTFAATALAIVLAQSFMAREGLARFEYAVLLLLAATGMSMMISANDLIALYMGIELQSLSLYIITVINRENRRAAEAGLKYFVLGALSSGLMLYGMSLIYGFSGTTQFAEIAEVLRAAETLPAPHVIGLVFLLAGLAFKLSAVPFHMWTPDVYEGAPTPVAAFLAAAPKLAAMAVLIRLAFVAFPDALPAWQQIAVFIAAASMLLGSFAAIGQSNIKRLMAYSSIGHIGFALTGLAAGSQVGVTAIIVYMLLYTVMTLGAFACILSMRRENGMAEQISDLAGLHRAQPYMAACLAIFMFSMAGLPPLAGFFGKLFVLRAAIDSELYVLAVLGVISSVVAAYYYLRIVKIIYVDAPAEETLIPMPRELVFTAGIAAAFVLLFFVWPLPFVSLAHEAGSAFFGAFPEIR